MPFIQIFPEGEDKKIQATLTAKGLLGLSADAIQAFGLESTTHVLLFFDPERRILGLRPAASDEPGALKLTRRKRITSLSIRPLLDQYRLVVPGKLIMEPALDEKENLVVIPLLGVRVRPGRRPTTTKPRIITRSLRTPAATGRRAGSPKAAAAPSKPAGRRRGRPPKEAAAAATAPKRRGRPPKAAAEKASTPKRRGRPRKTESPA